MVSIISMILTTLMHIKTRIELMHRDTTSHNKSPIASGKTTLKLIQIQEDSKGQVPPNSPSLVGMHLRSEEEHRTILPCLEQEEAQ